MGCFWPISHLWTVDRLVFSKATKTAWLTWVLSRICLISVGCSGSTGDRRWPHTRPLRANGLRYRGVNVLLLWGEAMAKGYTTAGWMTYRQAPEMHAQVWKGKHGALVVWPAARPASRPTRRAKNSTAKFIMKGYTVFNAEQIDGLPSSYTVPRPPPADLTAVPHRAPLRQ